MKMKRLIWVTGLLLVAFVIGGCIPFPKVKNYRAWVVGQTDTNGIAMLYFSDDSGETWTRQAMDILPEGKSLEDVLSVDENTVWACGSDGLLLKTTNGGSDWEIVGVSEVATDSFFSFLSIFEDRIWVSGDEGLVIFSDDDGGSWTVCDLPEMASEYIIQGIHAINEDVIYAVGNKSTPRAGIVLKSEDGGQTWEEIELPNNYNDNGWIGVKATDENHIVIHGGQGHYVVTANGGKQWVTGGPLFAKDLNSLVMLDSSTYWAACDFDTIILTENSGISWEEQPPAGTSNSFLLGIDALDRSNALVVGSSAGYPQFGKILRTKDGGKNWEVVLSAEECPVTLTHVSIAEKRM
ncbi:Photosystem II stability/assembly factor-like protein [Mesotoga infera]|nr:Photosystem II stability/assembly factor-like protein [Mesotoga infera]